MSQAVRDTERLSDRRGAVDELREHGFAVFQGLLDPDEINAWHEGRERLVRQVQMVTNDSRAPNAIENILERAPEIAWPVVSRPELLEFAEELMGPLVQLDATALVAEPQAPPDQWGAATRWHRDRFSFTPPAGTYLRPSVIVFIAYMQDMNDAFGPLRVIPGSHMEELTVIRSDQPQPLELRDDSLVVHENQPHHEREIFVSANVGDVVAVHHNLIHSAGANSTQRERRYFGFMYNLAQNKQEDNFSGPNCRALRSMAHEHRDERLIRLLGEYTPH